MEHQGEPNGVSWQKVDPQISNARLRVRRSPVATQLEHNPAVIPQPNRKAPVAPSDYASPCGGACPSFPGPAPQHGMLIGFAVNPLRMVQPIGNILRNPRWVDAPLGSRSTHPPFPGNISYSSGPESSEAPSIRPIRGELRMGRRSSAVPILSQAFLAFTWVSIQLFTAFVTSFTGEPSIRSCTSRICSKVNFPYEVPPDEVHS